MPAPNPIVQAIINGSRQRNIDPQAALAVSRQEGLSGGIGDNGHAFGPFQLNNAGGVITGRFPGQTPEQIQQWAQSPAGISYALDGIAKAAAGLRGPQAVNAIVTRFERPANPQREIQGALAAYGSPAPSPGVGAAAPAVSSSPAGARAPQAQSPIAAALSLLGFTGPAQQPLMQFTPSAVPETAAAPRVAPSTAGTAGARRLAAVPQSLDSRPGIQVDAAILPTVSQLAQKFGVKVNSGYRSSTHNAAVGGAENSDHLRGDAVDFTGPEQRLAALYQYAQGRFPYVEPMAQAKDHVHISFRRPA